MISVIVPIYKVEQYLDRCIESIAGQTCQNLEILLIDDGSPDSCGEICDRWAKRDERIRVVHKTNGGLSEARNTGILMARGEYLSFVDSDDWIESDMLEKLLDAILRENADIAVCNFVYEMSGCREEAEEKRAYQIQEEKVLSGREFMFLMDQGKYAFCEIACNKLYRKQIFANLRYPVGKIHEDEFVFHRMVYPCSRIACIPQEGYHYRKRPESITAGGRNSFHFTEALLDRGEYLLERQERELTISCAGRILAEIKRMQMTGDGRNPAELKHRYFHLSKEMYRYRWISFFTLLKRFVRCEWL